MKIRILFLVGLMLLLSSEAVASGWKFQTQEDPITGKTAKYAVTGAYNEAGRLEGLLALKCDDVTDPDTFWILVNMGSFLTSDSHVKVIKRFDKNPPQESRHFADGSFFYVTGEGELQLLEQIKKSNTLAIRAYDYEGDPHTVVFSLSGSTAAAAQLPCLK